MATHDQLDAYCFTEHCDDCYGPRACTNMMCHICRSLVEAAKGKPVNGRTSKLCVYYNDHFPS